MLKDLLEKLIYEEKNLQIYELNFKKFIYIYKLDNVAHKYNNTYIKNNTIKNTITTQ